MDRTRPSGPDRSHDLRCPRELALFSERQQLTLRPLGLGPSALLISSPKRMPVTRVQVLRSAFSLAVSPLPKSDLPTTRSPEGPLAARALVSRGPGDLGEGNLEDITRAVAPGLTRLDNNHGVFLSPLNIFRAPSACCRLFFLSLTPAGL